MHTWGCCLLGRDLAGGRSCWDYAVVAASRYVLCTLALTWLHVQLMTTLLSAIRGRCSGLAAEHSGRRQSDTTDQVTYL